VCAMVLDLQLQMYVATGLENSCQQKHGGFEADHHSLSLHRQLALVSDANCQRLLARSGCSIWMQCLHYAQRCCICTPGPCEKEMGHSCSTPKAVWHVCSTHDLTPPF